MTEVIYHGGNLDVPCDNGAMGLWATDDLEAARDYAKACAFQSVDGVAYVYRIQIEGRTAMLRDVATPELADRVESGEPPALAYSGIGLSLTERGIGVVLVPTGDEHPDTGRVHRSWWVAGEFTSEVVEEIHD